MREYLRKEAERAHSLLLLKESAGLSDWARRSWDATKKRSQEVADSAAKWGRAKADEAMNWGKKKAGEATDKAKETAADLTEKARPYVDMTAARALEQNRRREFTRSIMPSVDVPQGPTRARELSQLEGVLNYLRRRREALPVSGITGLAPWRTVTTPRDMRKSEKLVREGLLSIAGNRPEPPGPSASRVVSDSTKAVVNPVTEKLRDWLHAPDELRINTAREISRDWNALKSAADRTYGPVLRPVMTSAADAYRYLRGRMREAAAKIPKGAAAPAELPFVPESQQPPLG